MVSCFPKKEAEIGKKYIVTLADEEREKLRKIISSGTERARKLARARVLLKADANWQDADISEALDLSVRTIERIRRRFVEEGLEAALNRHPPRVTMYFFPISASFLGSRVPRNTLPVKLSLTIY